MRPMSDQTLDNIMRSRISDLLMHLDADQKDAALERAAIVQYEANLPRELAERLAIARAYNIDTDGVKP